MLIYNNYKILFYAVILMRPYHGLHTKSVFYLQIVTTYLYLYGSIHFVFTIIYIEIK